MIPALDVVGECQTSVSVGALYGADFGQRGQARPDWHLLGLSLAGVRRSRVAEEWPAPVEHFGCRLLGWRALARGR